ncbi:MAG: HDOD domain-containing protein [Dehalococcoidia bacterium]|nr:HDOD domain-containing protein [Dehalococcoidia bacterium]
MTIETRPTPRKSREDVLKAVASLPPLPAVALRVMQVAQDPKSSAGDLALIVSADPGLSATMLRVANSAAYRRAREVTSVQESLVVLGFVQARNIAMSSAIAGTYAPDALNALFRISAFWRHSIAVAFKASELAAKTHRLDVPSAFTAGILHNIGRLAIYFADPAGVDQAIAEAMRREEPFDTVEQELLGYDHAEIGGLLAERWNLPDGIREAIGAHHAAGEPDASLAGVVAAADRYCTAHGVLPGYVVPDAPVVSDDSPADFTKLIAQVDTLMELIGGEPVGVSR